MARPTALVRYPCSTPRESFRASRFRVSQPGSRPIYDCHTPQSREHFVLYTKVKLFQQVISVSGGNSASAGGFKKLETEINQFLADNPRAKPVDLKITSHAAPVGDSVTN